MKRPQLSEVPDLGVLAQVLQEFDLVFTRSNMFQSVPSPVFEKLRALPEIQAPLQEREMMFVDLCCKAL